MGDGENDAGSGEAAAALGSASAADSSGSRARGHCARRRYPNSGSGGPQMTHVMARAVDGPSVGLDPWEEAGVLKGIASSLLLVTASSGKVRHPEQETRLDG